MNRFFFQKLAVSNLKKNRQTVVPYLFTSMITAAVYYIMLSLSQNPGLNDMSAQLFSRRFWDLAAESS